MMQSSNALVGLKKAKKGCDIISFMSERYWMLFI